MRNCLQNLKIKIQGEILIILVSFTFARDTETLKYRILYSYQLSTKHKPK